MKPYKKIGNGRSLGTKLISLDGYFNNPGLYEVDMGTPMSFIIDEIGGGFNDILRHIQIGGPLGGVVPVDILRTLTLDFEVSLKGDFCLVMQVLYVFLNLFLQWSMQNTCSHLQLMSHAASAFHVD